MTSSPAALDAAFAALGDPVRRALVSRLARGDATVGELAAPFDLTQQAVRTNLEAIGRHGACPIHRPSFLARRIP